MNDQYQSTIYCQEQNLIDYNSKQTSCVLDTLVLYHKAKL